MADKTLYVEQDDPSWSDYDSGCIHEPASDGQIKAAAERLGMVKPPLPTIGSVWVWEPEKPHAREIVTVVDVSFNGDEWWVSSRNADDVLARNSLDRWVEATVFHAMKGDKT